MRKEEYADWVERCTGVKIGIIQHGKLVMWETTLERVEQFVVELEMAVKLGNGENPPFEMGSHCRFCPCIPICPEQQDLAHAALSAGDGWSENLAYWIDHADQLIEFGNKIKTETHTLLEKGGKVEGWKLVAKRAARKWADISEAEELLRKIARRSSNDVRISDLFASKILTPAQIEKLFKKKGVALENIEEYIVSQSSGTTLATADDKRPEIVLTADRLGEIGKRLSSKGL